MSESTSEAPVESQVTTDAVGTLLQDAPAPTEQTTEAPADQTSTEATEGEDSGEKSEDEAKPEEHAPEAYEAFTAPEGVALADEVVEGAKAVFKELDLSQAKAQLVVDKLAPLIAQSQQAALDAAIQEQTMEWVQAAKADPEIGKNLPEALANANRVANTFGSPELRDMLVTSGLGNNPAVIKFFNAVYQKIAPDTFVQGQPETKVSKSLYPNSNMNR